MSRSTGSIETRRHLRAWACRRTPSTSSPSRSARGLARLGAVKLFYMAGSPIPREVAAAFLAQGITPQNIYGMTENGSHQYTLPGRRDRDHRRRPAGAAATATRCASSSRTNPDLEVPAGEVGEIGGARRAADARLLRQPGGHRGLVQHATAGSCPATSARWMRAAACASWAARRTSSSAAATTSIRREIEDLALRHAAVQRPPPSPVADERLGEKVCLAVICREGEPSAAEELLEHLHAWACPSTTCRSTSSRWTTFRSPPAARSSSASCIEWVRIGRIAPHAGALERNREGAMTWPSSCHA